MNVSNMDRLASENVDESAGGLECRSNRGFTLSDVSFHT